MAWLYYPPVPDWSDPNQKQHWQLLVLLKRLVLSLQFNWRVWWVFNLRNCSGMSPSAPEVEMSGLQKPLNLAHAGELKGLWRPLVENLRFRESKVWPSFFFFLNLTHVAMQLLWIIGFLHLNWGRHEKMTMLYSKQRGLSRSEPGSSSFGVDQTLNRQNVHAYNSMTLPSISGLRTPK